MTMIADGVTAKGATADVLDLAEIVANRLAQGVAAHAN